MAELQGISAACHVAQLAGSTAQLIWRICAKTDDEAQALANSTNQIHRLAECVRELLKQRTDAHGNVQGSLFEMNVCEAIENSLQECDRSLHIIQKQLQPFSEQIETVPIPQRLVRNAIFVFAGDSRNTQLSIINRQISSLNLSISLLTNYTLQNGHAQQTTATATTTRGIVRQEGVVPQILDSGEVISEGRHALQIRSIFAAVEANNEVQLKQLIASGIDVTVRDEDEWTLLHHAAKRLNLEVFVVLLLSSPDAQDPNFLNAFSSQNQTALMMVADQASNPLSVQLAEVLLQQKCDIHLEDGSGRSALSFAMNGPEDPKRIEFIRLLYNGGADMQSVRLHRNFDRFWPMIDSSMAVQYRRNSVSDLVRTQSETSGNASDNQIQVLFRLLSFPIFWRRKRSAGGTHAGRKRRASAPAMLDCRTYKYLRD